MIIASCGILVIMSTLNPWIRNPSFDLTLVLGTAGLALGSGIIFCVWPNMFPLILFLDLWILGYHHVVATFSRLTFDLASYKEHKFLVVWLPIIMVAVIVPVVFMTGPWILATAYLYWQWFHYMRQSYGVARIYQRKAGGITPFTDGLEQAVIYAVPIWGILNRSYQNPGTFLGVELKVIPVSAICVDIAMWVSMAILLVWLGHKCVLSVRGELDGPHTVYQLTHLAIFYTAYILITDINFGWLVINIWHNAQYILFVWMFNNNRFKSGVDLRHKFLSTLSQRKNMIWYFLVFVLIAGVVYKSIDLVLGVFAASTLAWAVIVYQTINFHHYIVDGIIWKIRKKPIQDNLGLSA